MPTLSSPAGTSDPSLNKIFIQGAGHEIVPDDDELLLVPLDELLLVPLDELLLVPLDELLLVRLDELLLVPLDELLLELRQSLVPMADSVDHGPCPHEFTAAIL